jgi:hypothetical protein
MALEFTGDADRVVWNDASFLVGLSALTFSCWVKCNATLPYDIGFFKTNNTWGSDDGIGIRYDAVGANGGGSQVLKCGITISGKECNIETSEFSQTNEWQFVTMAWESPDDIEIYLDGQFDTPDLVINAPHSGVTGPGNINQVYLGTGAKGSDSTGWNGLMEDVRFYDRKLSAAEIQTIYATRGNDFITNGLLFRVLFNELPVSETATTSSIVDISGRLGDADTVGGTPTYVDSPGFASRRKNRQ